VTRSRLYLSILFLSYYCHDINAMLSKLAVVTLIVLLNDAALVVLSRLRSYSRTRNVKNVRGELRISGFLRAKNVLVYVLLTRKYRFKIVQAWMQSWMHKNCGSSISQNGQIPITNPAYGKKDSNRTVQSSDASSLLLYDVPCSLQ
jgi:hypothetical protein